MFYFGLFFALIPHQHPKNHINKHTCLYSHSPSHFQENCGATGYHSLPKDPVYHNTLYISSIVYMYFQIVYMLLGHRSTKKSFVARFTKLTQVFNSHLLMVLVLNTCNTFLGWNFTTSSLNFSELTRASNNFRQQPSEVHPRFYSPSNLYLFPRFRYIKQHLIFCTLY